MRKALATTALSILVAAASAQGGDPQYALPLKTPYRISGTFGELRGNHYHAGLDMGTAGVENIEVHAAEDGCVSRVKVGPYGYGRALYIDHPDGHTTVYGHLNGFAPKIDSLVRREQYALESFDVQIFPRRGEVPVRRDEVVALSGNTGGSGGPHLHFEVRDTRTEEPLNPLRFIETAADDVPPTIYGVKIYALSPDAQVAGGHADRYLPLAQAQGKTIDAVGTIGVGIHCTDHVCRSGRPCGVVEINLYDGDTLVYHSRVDRFPFDLNRHVNSHIDFGESVTNRRFVQRSLVEPGNRLPIYGTVRTPTTVGEGETHAMRYEILDFAGNKTSLCFTLRGRRNKALGPKGKPKGESVERERTWAKDTMGIDVVIPRHALYDDHHVDIVRTMRRDGRPPLFSIGSETVPLQKEMTLTMSVPARWKTLGRQVYVGRRSADGTLAYVGGETRTDTGSANVTLIAAKTARFGTYTIDVDSAPPTISVRNKGNNVRRDGWIFLGVADDKSGVAKYDVRIDGKWQVFEYDYKRARLKANVGYLAIGRGRHKLQATVEDACGNSRSMEWEFVVN